MTSTTKFADPTTDVQNARLDAALEQFAQQTPTPKITQPDLTAGRRSVERVFYYLIQALTAGVPSQMITDLYHTRAEQLDRNPNSTSKRVCRELSDLIAAQQSKSN